MQATPNGMRLHIGLFGRRNVGKSALLNALTGQGAAIVSEVPGSTTDPVAKAMELAPLGPVQLIDTAGIDDVRCGACMHGRRETLSYIMSCVAQGVPITNYGLVIAQWLGLLPRVLRPFGLDANGAAMGELRDPAATNRREEQCGRDRSWRCVAAREAVR